MPHARVRTRVVYILRIYTIVTTIVVCPCNTLYYKDRQRKNDENEEASRRLRGERTYERIVLDYNRQVLAYGVQHRIRCGARSVITELEQHES